MRVESGEQRADDRAELLGYVEVWWGAVGDLLTLLESLPEAAWAAPTDLPGWDVRAVAAHCAHLESRLAGALEETAEIGRPAHVTGLMGAYTEIGVVNRRTASPAAVVAELREATTRRHEQLLADPPTDGAAVPEVTFGGVHWSWRVLLRNRVLDLWMHEQDVRRAVGRPGGLDTEAATHTLAYLAESLGYVLAKRVAAPPGSSVLLQLEGMPPRAFVVDENGRGRPLADPPEAPTVTLRADRDSYARLAGGRSAPEPGGLVVSGDAELARRIVDNLATTP